jgi:predicted ATPase
MVDAIVSDAQASGDMLTLCQTLVQAACPVALFNGDMDSAQHYVGMLVEFSGRDTLQFWQVWGRCFESVLRVRSGELGTGLPLLGTSLADLRAIQFGVYYIVFAADYASALAATGDVRRALQILEEAFARSEQNAELWYMPELLRVRGELQLASAEHDSGLLAEASFREAIDLARAQQTPAWELRAATSLGRLLLKGGRDHEVEPLLGPVYDRFTEGHDTADLRDAQAVLDSLRGS